jgi:hypothetical protein
VAELPGTDEAAPTVEGQVIPPASTALLNSSDLLSSLNLTDYTPSDIDPFSLSDDDDDSDDSDNSDDDNKSDKKKTTGSTSKPGTKTSSGGSTPSPSDGDDSDSDSDEEEVEGPKHKQWREDMAAYEDDHEEWEEREEAYDKCMGGDSKLTNLKAFCKSKEPGDEPDKPDEPDFTS